MTEKENGILGFVLGILGGLFAAGGVWFGWFSALAALAAAGTGLIFALRGWGQTEQQTAALTVSGAILNAAALTTVQILFGLRLLDRFAAPLV